jgi:histone H3/H4
MHPLKNVYTITYNKIMDDILLPVLEASMVYACHYCKATGRETVTSTDVQYGLKYATRVILGKKIGSIFPEIYVNEDDSDEEPVEVVDDEDEPFVRYTGDEAVYNEMNRVVDEWDQWIPESPAEILLKNSIDKTKA